MILRTLRIIGFFAGLLAAGAALAAEQVPVRGGVHADFGRLVFDWQTPVSYTAEIVDGRLTVRFDRPASFDTASAEQHLFRYLEGVSAAGDGRSVSFELEGGYGLKAFTLGPKVVIDLMNAGGPSKAAGGPRPPEAPAATQAAPAAQPAPAAQAAAAPQPTPAPTSAPEPPAAAEAGQDPPPAVRVRVGEHPDFERLVFDWSAPVGFTSAQDGQSAEVIFDDVARLDVSRLQANPPTLLRRFADRRADGQTRVSLSVVPGTRLRVFGDGPRVVVDLLRPTGEVPAEPAEILAEDRPEPAAPGEPAAQIAADQPTAEENEAEPDAAESEAPTSLLPAEEAEPEAAAASEETVPEPAAAPEPAPEPEPETAEAPPAPAVEASEPNDAAPERGFVSREPVPEADGRPMPGSLAPQTPTVLLRFGWEGSVGAIAMRRGPGLLLGFDQTAPVDLAGAVAELAPELGPVANVDVEGGSLLRFDGAPFYEPHLFTDNGAWMVEFRRAGSHSLGGPPIQTVQGEDQAQIHIAVDRPQTLMQVQDPSSGDALTLVPLAGDGQSMAEGRDFQAFELLPTAQGLAILPRIDPLEIALADDGVRIAAPLSSVTPGRSVTLAERGDGEGAPPRLLDLPAWRQGGPEDFNERRQELQRAVIDASGDDLGLARLELARFYFAHGLGSEALGVLNLIRRENKELGPDPQLLLMEAASRLLIGDHAEAQELLGDPALLNEPEADLWRAALAAEARDWAAAASLFAETEPLVEDYARPVRVRLGLSAAEARLEAGDPGGASMQLDAVKPDLVTDLEHARYDFLSALMLDAEGEVEEAQQMLERLAAAGLGAPSVQARLALIDRALASGGMTADTAIEQLEQLRFAWRGDSFEFALLQRLAELYEREGRWREALRALRQAATYFPGTSRAEAAAQQLSALFARLFIGPDRPDIPPLTSLSLYEEFRELTPPGERGNRLIEQLADRLVAVDLLDRAAGLLEGQIQFRLSGEEKSRVGSRLAVIRLLDRQPRKALEALEISAVPEVPAELEAQRRHLQARALSDLDRSTQALTLLAGDESLDAQRLRAEILWAERDWDAAAVALGATLPAPSEVPTPLPAEISGQVLNLAVAHTLAGDLPRLEALRSAWAEAMAQGPHAEAFSLLAEDLDPTSVATIAQQLAQVDRVQAFMANYRERLRETQLSDLN
jgi:hypothetical protein